MKNLIELDVSNNQIESIPTFIDSMVNLSKFFANDNRIADLPLSVFQLKSLTVLELRNNMIKIIPPEFSQLTQLIRLDISNNNLTDIPNSIKRMKNLKVTLFRIFNSYKRF